MKQILYSLFIVTVLVSCAESYSIQGSSSLAILDGSKLYLKAIDGKDMRTIDSCDVVHGKFRFAGLLDTTLMAAVYMGDKIVLPLVVERGDIKVRIEDTQQHVSGSPLNEVLYGFLDKHKQLDMEMEELDHRYSRMLLEGIDEDTITRELMTEAKTIAQREDSLVTNFVVDNFENVLGPFIFIQMSSSVPQIEHIMSKAPDSFKAHPTVNEFYQQVTASGMPAADEPAVATSPQDIDDATIQDILNGR
jgi:hypothetical protein